MCFGNGDEAMILFAKVEIGCDAGCDMTLATIDKLQKKARALKGRPVPGLRMTEAQFVAWCDEDVRAEWVNGEVILMSPANVDHVELNHFVWTLAGEFVKSKKLGRVLGIEAQARLDSIPSRRNPDVLFVTRKRTSIIKPTFIDGPPDLIMEIVSPDSESRDWREKFYDYQTSGVREYWIIDLQSQRVEAYALVKKKYRLIVENSDQIKSKVLRGFFIRPSWLWKQPLPRVGKCLREMGVKL